MVAATIYVSCRDSEIPCTLNDVTKATGLTKSSIARCYRIILVTLNLQMPVSNIEQCVFRIAKKMEVPEKIKHHAIRILDYASKRNHLAGKDPMGISAAVIYLASMDYGGKISQRKLAKIAMITEVTIRNRCKGLQDIH